MQQSNHNKFFKWVYSKAWMATENKVKMGVISGASLALKLKQEKPHSTDAQILQEISYDMSEILEKIDKSI
jgi:hypothetical protein